MFRIESKVNTSSEAFKENVKLNKEQHLQLKERLDQIRPGGTEKARKVHEERGKTRAGADENGVISILKKFIDALGLSDHVIHVDGDAKLLQKVDF